MTRRKLLNTIIDHLKSKLHLVLCVPALLCLLTLTVNLVHALKDGYIDSNELHILLASADGFETILLIIVMFALKDKNK